MQAPEITTEVDTPESRELMARCDPMTAVAPHIRALRAEAKALSDEATRLGKTSEQLTAAFVLLGMASAKLCAADELEAEQQVLLLGLKLARAVREAAGDARPIQRHGG